MFNDLLNEYPALMELGGLLMLIRISAHIPERIKRMTRGAILLLMGAVVCYHVEMWTHSFPELSLLRPMLTACSYTLYPLILFYLMRIILREDLPRKKLLLLLLPELVTVPIYFSSQWTKLVFWFTQSNIYQGGPLSTLPYWVVVFYGMLFLYQNYAYFKKFNRKDQVTAAFTILSPLLGMVLMRTFVNDGKYSTLLASAILLYYTFLYIHMAKIDPLTSLFNRKCFYEDIQARGKFISAVVSVDMNDLKYFNDNLGHQAGDKALQIVAEILRKYCGKGGTAYRVGGDEFNILYSNASESWIREAIAEMRKKLSQTPYTCAFGLAMLWPGESIEKAIVEADQAMYADKAAIKMHQRQKRRTIRDEA